jgi:hypothetical protein
VILKKGTAKTLRTPREEREREQCKEDNFASWIVPFFSSHSVLGALGVLAVFS